MPVMHSFAARMFDSLSPLTRAFFFNVPYSHNMTNSVPDSFSMDELSKALENAPQEEDLHHAAENSDKEFTPEFIEGIAQEMLELATEKCPDPLVHKVMAMMVICRMVDWHKTVAKSQLEDGNEASMGAWMRDAGKFQACMDILTSIAVGPQDFTVPE